MNVSCVQVHHHCNFVNHSNDHKNTLIAETFQSILVIKTGFIEVSEFCF